MKSILFLLMIIAAFILHAIYLNCIAEDAFISFRFSKNLANGDGLVWNRGEPPVEGYTNFLWMILSALFLKLGLNMTLTIQTIGVLASIGTLLYTYKFSYSALGLQRTYALIPCLFLASSGPFATWSASGMETNFFGFFLLLGCYYFVQAWIRNSPKDMYLCYVALLIATLTRPEGLIVFGVIFILHVFLSSEGNRNLSKGLLLPALLYLLPYSIYFLWRFSYYGYLLPNTFYAKMGGGVYQYVRGAIYSAYFAVYFILPLMPLFIFARKEMLHARIHLVRWQKLRTHIKNHVGIYCPAFVSLTYVLCIIYVGGDYMAMYRFFVPILPFLYTLFGFYIGDLFSSTSAFAAKGFVIRGFVLFAVLATVFQSTPWEKQVFPKPPFQHGHFRGVEQERWHSNRLTLLGTFFDGYRRNEDEAVATDAVGAVSYYADMKIYDIFGLTDVQIAHQKGRNNPSRSGLAGHEKRDHAYILSKRPTYIMFNRKLTKKPVKAENPDTFPNYKHTSVWLVDQRNKEEGFFTFLELKR